MTLVFLETVESAAPGYPFQAGQRIAVPRLTPEMQQWIQAERATLLREDRPELAVLEPVERAVTRRGKAKGRTR